MKADVLEHILEKLRQEEPTLPKTWEKLGQMVDRSFQIAGGSTTLSEEERIRRAQKAAKIRWAKEKQAAKGKREAA